MAAFRAQNTVRLKSDIDSNVREDLAENVILEEGELLPVKKIPAGSEGLVVMVIEAREPVYLINFEKPFPSSATVAESQLALVEPIV